MNPHMTSEPLKSLKNPFVMTSAGPDRRHPGRTFEKPFPRDVNH
mgnify:CR=1 FL=1